MRPKTADTLIPSNYSAKSPESLGERWFAEITRKRIRRGTFRRVQELTQAIHEYIRTYNWQPRPFHWVASARRIIRKVNKCKDTSETAD